MTNLEDDPEMEQIGEQYLMGQYRSFEKKVLEQS